MSNSAAFQMIVEYPASPLATPYAVYQDVIETARPANQYLSVSGALGNNRIDTHVISLKRYASLCNPPQRGRLVLDTSFPRTTINPGEPLVMWEQGVKVFTGYVTKVTRSRPSYEWVIDFEDTYTRVINYFISDSELVFNTPTSMKYLIQTILDPTGINYRIGGPDYAVAPGVNLSMRSAHDALSEVLAYGNLYAWVDPDGTLRLRRSPGLRFQQNVQDPISTQEVISTDQTRNRVVIYGGTMTGLPAGSTVIPPQVNIEAHKSISGLLVDLSTVVANPLITTFPDAERMGDALLRELGSLSDVITFEIEGNPVLKMGTSGSFYHQFTNGSTTSGSGPITAMETTLDENGYRMNVTIGEKCPRLAGWTQPYTQTRAIWIASKCLVTNDPRPNKLVWTGDFGFGGQPTYNMVKTIPSGTIQGMHVTRDGTRVYLLMYNSSTTKECLYYSDNPYYGDPTWNVVVQSGDPAPGGKHVDSLSFNLMPILSAQMVVTTLYFTVRVVLGANRYYQCAKIGLSDSTLTWIGEARDINVGTFNPPIITRGAVAQAESATIIRFRVPPNGSAICTTPSTGGFTNSLSNGAVITVDRATGNWWLPDTGTGHLLYCGVDGNSLRDFGSTIFTSVGNLPYLLVHIRGDYWGTQYQFVDNLGTLYTGQLGGGPSAIFTWNPGGGLGGPGVVICLDKSNPKRLAWFPNTAANSNEMARYSSDGGQTWAQMTGNWWGFNAGVTAGNVMQSAGNFGLIDAHPTFYGIETIPEDGA